MTDGNLENSVNTLQDWESGKNPNPNASTSQLMKMLALAFLALIAILAGIVTFLRGTPPPPATPLHESVTK